MCQGQMLCICYRVHASNLGASITALDTQLVDLRLSDVSSLFSLVQLVLQFTELAQMSIGLLFLQDSTKTQATILYYYKRQWTWEK